jgi:hypothetical protein
MPDGHLCSRDLVLLYQHSGELEEDCAEGNNPVPLYQFPVFRGKHEIRGKNTISFRIYCNREE